MNTNTQKIKPSEPHSVYLDTNILILGPKRKEHELLKEKSKRGELALYISDVNKIEQHGKILLLLRKKDNALRLYDSLVPAIITDKKLTKKVIDCVNKTVERYEQARKDEEIEKSFWKDAKLLPVRSTFAVDFLLGGIDQTFNLEIRNEINLLEKLLIRYKIKGPDAVHIIQACSADMDYFLTWDEPLIKKIKRISWIAFKILTPKEFLKKTSIYTI